MREECDKKEECARWEKSPSPLVFGKCKNSGVGCFCEDDRHQGSSCSAVGYVPGLVSETTFRGTPMVNMTEDMVKVELIMTRNEWHRVRKTLKDLDT